MGDPTRDFIGVYESEKRRLLRVAFAIAGSWEAAEDAVAEAVARSWPKFREGGVADLGGYLYRAVVNAAVAPSRRRALHDRFAPRLASPVMEAAPDEPVADRDLVRRTLRVLPPGQRAALVLRFLEDMTEAEAARVLGVSVGTVKSRVSRALGALRESMEVTTSYE